MIKYSQFNTIIPFEQEYALYNSFTQKVIFIVSELKDLLDASLNEGVEKIINYHPSFYNYLITNEFLINENIDELEKVKTLSKKHLENKNEFLLTINPTMNCNFKCWYCYETHIKNSKLDVDGVERIKKFIKNIAEDRDIKRIPLSFFGGEPLLYFEKNIIPIVDFYHEQCLKNNIHPEIGFTTNGFLINERFIDYFNEKKIDCSFQITLDGHKEDHNKVRFVNSKTGSYDKIVQNIHSLVKNQYLVSVRVNYTDKNIKESKKIIYDFLSLPKEIKENYLIIDFHRVWQNENGLNIDDELKEIMNILRKNHFNVEGRHSSLNNVKSPCYADTRNSVTINYNGDIYKCTARDFTKENREGYIDENGNLKWENDSLNKRLESKFKNAPCLKCKILPICNGGCSQAAIENVNNEYCIFGFDEAEKDKIIQQKIAEIKNKKDLLVEQESICSKI